MYVFTKHFPYAEVLNKCTEEHHQSISKFSMNDILNDLEKKLPITIDELFKITSYMQSENQLISILKPYVKRKSALSRKQLVKVSLYAYKHLR